MRSIACWSGGANRHNNLTAPIRRHRSRDTPTAELTAQSRAPFTSSALHFLVRSWPRCPRVRQDDVEPGQLRVDQALKEKETSAAPALGGGFRSCSFDCRTGSDSHHGLRFPAAPSRTAGFPRSGLKACPFFRGPSQQEQRLKCWYGTHTPVFLRFDHSLDPPHGDGLWPVLCLTTVLMVSPLTKCPKSLCPIRVLSPLGRRTFCLLGGPYYFSFRSYGLIRQSQPPPLLRFMTSLEGSLQVVNQSLLPAGF